jgi:hypothetical protein
MRECSRRARGMHKLGRMRRLGDLQRDRFCALHGLLLPETDGPVTARPRHAAAEVSVRPTPATGTQPRTGAKQAKATSSRTGNADATAAAPAYARNPTGFLHPTSSWRSTRISSSFARSQCPTSTINSSRRQTTMYSADTGKGDLQQTGGSPRYRRLSSARVTRSRFCTPRGPACASAVTFGVLIRFFL